MTRARRTRCSISRQIVDRARRRSPPRARPHVKQRPATRPTVTRSTHSRRTDLRVRNDHQLLPARCIALRAPRTVSAARTVVVLGGSRGAHDARARRGAGCTMTDHTEFTAAVESLRPVLRLHCYRMLGSSHDSDDLVQETLLRAWRKRDTLADPARVKPWLFRIATNACLDELAQRPRRALAADLHPPVPGDTFPPAPPTDDAPWLEPMPDTWLVGCATDPAARYTLRESVALAFVAALQVLSPAQRATLLLRDVAGLSAEEAADALDQSLSATNS